jgi:hypothetical protein
MVIQELWVAIRCNSSGVEYFDADTFDATKDRSEFKADEQTARGKYPVVRFVMVSVREVRTPPIPKSK